MLEAHTIKNKHSDLFTFLRGDLGAVATTCRHPELSCENSLVYVSNQAHLCAAARHRVAIVIVHRKLLPNLEMSPEWQGCFFSVTAMPAAMAALLHYFDTKRERFTQWGERHPTAVVHSSATLGKNVVLGPYCVIGAGTFIGDDCLVGSHTIVESEARIGARTILHPHVFVGSRCEIGDSCEIHPHTSIGSDGFGYARDACGRPRKIAQLGNVVIGNDVEIGSNCAIDRATLTSTIIRSGTKLDNICHIAHNCDLGENGLYTAGFIAAGSTKIGRQCVTGGNTLVYEHLTVADNVMLAARSTVSKDVGRAGAYGGHPLQNLQDSLRTTAIVGNLSRWRKDLLKVKRHLGLTVEASPQG